MLDRRAAVGDDCMDVGLDHDIVYREEECCSLCAEGLRTSEAIARESAHLTATLPLRGRKLLAQLTASDMHDECSCVLCAPCAQFLLA